MKQFSQFRLSFFLVVCVISFANPDQAAAQANYTGPKDLPHLKARLPQYCYAQYFDPRLHSNPAYSIMNACGGWANHFCPGLLNIMRAESAAPIRYQMNGRTHTVDRRYELKQARENIEYTLRGMKPNCVYANDVQLALKRIELLEKIVR